MTKWSVAAALVVAALLITSVSGQQKNRSDNFVPGEVLVQFNRSVSRAEKNASLNSRNARSLRHFSSVDIDLVSVPPGWSIAAAVGGLRGLRGVINVQPNYVRHGIPGGPTDPLWLDDTLWGLKKIQADQVWSNYTVGSSDIVIADIDTGINYSHPDLAANAWRNPLEVPGNGIDDDGNGYVDDVFGIDTVNHDSNPFDDQGHGTHTAGTLSAVGNNGIGVVGVNWNAKVLSCKFLSAEGSGTDAGAIECFDYILAMRNRGVNIRVSSNSWGSQRGSTMPATALMAAIDAAGAAGIINVFGAGNDGSDNDLAPFDPASYGLASIISVASSGPTDRRSFFSNYGATSVHLAAPGEEIASTYLGTDYVSESGTSMATPHVAGAAALLLSMDPSLSVPALKSLLLNNVDQSSRWSGRVVSGGRLNVYKAAQAISNNPNNEPPVVSMVTPIEGASFKAPVNVALEASASDPDGSIAQVIFYANGVPVGNSTTAPFVAIWPNASPGTYTVTAIARDDKFATTVSAPVHITVLDNTPPTVSVTSPAAGATFASPAMVNIEADAADSDGAIVTVQFFGDDQLLGADSIAPYTLSWAPAAGAHTLKAVATDNLGKTTTSAIVSISVNTIPGRFNVALASNGGVATASSILGPNYPAAAVNNGDRKGLNWGAGGGWNDGTLNAGPDWLEVNFRGLKLIEEVNVFSMQDSYHAPLEPTPTMTFSLWGLKGFEMQYWNGLEWVALPGGVVTNNNLVWRKALFVPVTTSKIRIFITQAQNGYARAMEVEAWGVAAAGNTAPTVAISSPAEGASFLTPASVSITASADDEDGTVDHVDFFVDGTFAGTDAAAPYTASWSNSTIGPHTITAVATDNQGATSTSAPIHFTVAAMNIPPTITLTGPADGSVFIAPGGMMLTADASDSDGTIASVAFYANGSLIGTDTTAPYSLPWTGVGIGSYALSAVATDNLGESTPSAIVNVTVNPVPGRKNMALATNGGVATASSVLGPNYLPQGAINGDRRGLNWGAGGGWNDGTPNASPDWIEVAFNGVKLIDEVNVFSMQDNYTAPLEPTPSMMFTQWGLRGFEVQYWTGTAWAVVPGGSIVNNNLVWRQVVFSPIATSRIRINVTAAFNGYSRVMEVEAWGAGTVTNEPPTVSITAPASGTSFAAPASMTITAQAADSDGTVTQVAFLANGAQIGLDTFAPFAFAWMNVGTGTYTLTAVATDSNGATTTSAPVTVSVTASAPSRANQALASNGGVATASSQLTANYPPAGAINGDRRGASWGAGGGWNDGTLNAGPDWLEVAFAGLMTIDEVNVFSMQDAYTTPIEPTPTMTFTTFGLRAFEVQYWDGAAWVRAPGAVITNNNLVWRRFTFAPVTTTRVRVFITGALNGYARVMELEAWGVPAASPAPAAELVSGAALDVQYPIAIKALTKSFQHGGPWGAMERRFAKIQYGFHRAAEQKGLVSAGRAECRSHCGSWRSSR